MRQTKINIKHATPIKDGYQLITGNGYTNKFSSLKELSKFCVALNQFIGDQIFLLSQLHTQINQVYNVIYLYTDYETNNKNEGIDRKIKEYLNAFHDIRYDLFYKSNYKSGAYYIFSDAQKLCKYLTDICHYIIHKLADKSIKPHLKQIDFYINQIAVISKNISEFQHSTCAVNTPAQARILSLFDSYNNLTQAI